MMRNCWHCQGRGYVSDGRPEDGRMTGRMTCATCGGSGKVTDSEMLAYIEHLLEAE